MFGRSFVTTFTLYFTLSCFGGILYGTSKTEKDSLLFASEEVQLLRVKPNSTETLQNAITLNHFFERGYSDEVSNWNVSSAITEIWTKHLVYKLEINQGDMVPVNEDFWGSGICHQFGIEASQNYENNDAAFFGLKYSVDELFPKLHFNGGYKFKLANTVDAQLEIIGLDFRNKRNLFIVAPSITKNYYSHQLMIKPYYSSSIKEKLDVIVGIKFNLKDNDHLDILLSSGFYPENNAYLYYNYLDKGKYQAKLSGSFNLNDTYSFLPSAGIEVVEITDHNYYWNWMLQIGMKIKL